MADNIERQDAPADQEGTPAANKAKKRKKKIIIVSTPERDYTPSEIGEYIKTDEGRAATESMIESISNLSEIVRPTVEALQNVTQEIGKVSDTVHKVREIKFDISQIVQAMMRASMAPIVPEGLDFEALEKFYTEFEELAPYLEAELRKYPEYDGKTIDDLLDDIPWAATPYLIAEPEERAAIKEKETAEGEETDPETEQRYRMIDDLLAIRDAARAAKVAAETIIRTAAKRTDSIEYPLDKPNSILWNLLEKDTAGQIEFNLAKDGSKLYLPAFYSINFDGLGNDISITKRLTPFDKLAYIAVAALFNAGNNIVTLSQIYYAMGYTGTPGDTDRVKIYNAVHKMRTADIFFDNEQEAAKYKYTRFKYEGALLPCEIGQAVINGKWTDKALHVFREPPLITFAKERKQITTLDIKLLQAPVSKTDANLQIQDYLLERISRARKNRKKKEERILFKTLYAHANITTNKQQQRAPKKIEKYLEYYVQEGFIKEYEMEKDGVTVRW